MKTGHFHFGRNIALLRFLLIMRQQYGDYIEKVAYPLFNLIDPFLQLIFFRLMLFYYPFSFAFIDYIALLMLQQALQSLEFSTALAFSRHSAAISCSGLPVGINPMHTSELYTSVRNPRRMSSASLAFKAIAAALSIHNPWISRTVE